MTAPSYRDEPWFALLVQTCQARSQRTVALAVGLSEGAISQVLNGTGFYGSGKASTARIGQLVTHRFGRFQCPHLTALFEEPREIPGDECAAHAHGPVPTGSPGAIAHWRACQTCPHRAYTAPPEPRIPRPRKARAVSPVQPPEEACS